MVDNIYLGTCEDKQPQSVIDCWNIAGSIEGYTTEYVKPSCLKKIFGTVNPSSGTAWPKRLGKV
jgi:hypothetical protein